MRIRTTTSRAIALFFGPCLSFSSVANAQGSEKLKQAPDESWLSISGTIVSTQPTSFRLDHGAGVVTVEMDDHDFYDEARNLLVNDQVIVYGRIDDDLFERRSIEASSVFVEDLGTFFHASSVDEEDSSSLSVVTPIPVGRADVVGLVTSIDGRDMTIGRGLASVKVDTSTLSFNPLDDDGYLRIDVGDRVRVSGEIDDPLFGERELDADRIFEISRTGGRDGAG